MSQGSLSRRAAVIMTANINGSCPTPGKMTISSNVVSWSLNKMVTSQTSCEHSPGPFVTTERLTNITPSLHQLHKIPWTRDNDVKCFNKTVFSYINNWGFPYTSILKLCYQISVSPCRLVTMYFNYFKTKWEKKKPKPKNILKGLAKLQSKNIRWLRKSFHRLILSRTLQC